MQYVYIIQSTKNGKFYIGSTGDLNRRLKEHNKNQVRSTKHKGPWRLVHKEGLDTKCEAIKREHCIKKLKGNNSFKRLVKKVPPSSSLV